MFKKRIRFNVSGFFGWKLKLDYSVDTKSQIFQAKLFCKVII